MAKTVEPPILMSRILMFVLAASIVVLGALVFTLIKMMPLERPEVFFLRTPTRLTNVVIDPLTPDATNKKAQEDYIKGFIREYVIARNTLNPNTFALKTNWSKVVRPWSSKDVYSDFVNTKLYKAFTLNEQAPLINCSVNFSNSNREPAVFGINKDTYNVNFMWVCENIGGQTVSENYKIQIRIQSDLDEKVSGVFDNLEKLSINPLGIQVVQYTPVNGAKDPLNSDVVSKLKI